MDTPPPTGPLVSAPDGTIHLPAEIVYDPRRGVLYVHSCQQVDDPTAGLTERVMPTPIRVSGLSPGFDLRWHTLDLTAPPLATPPRPSPSLRW